MRSTLDCYRSYEFLVVLLDLLLGNEDISMLQAVQECYDAILKPYHGWMLQNTFTVWSTCILSGDVQTCMPCVWVGG